MGQRPSLATSAGEQSSGTAAGDCTSTKPGSSESSTPLKTGLVRWGVIIGWHAGQSNSRPLLAGIR